MSFVPLEKDKMHQFVHDSGARGNQETHPCLDMGSGETGICPGLFAVAATVSPRSWEDTGAKVG